MSGTAFTMTDFLDRVWMAVGSERSEEEKRLFYVDLYVIAPDALQDTFRDPKVQGTPQLRALTEATWAIPLAGSLGVAPLDDDYASRDPVAPNIMIDMIRTVYHLSPGGVRTKAYKLSSVEDLDQGQPLGLIWWYPRDNTIETISATGATRYTPSDLTGSLEVHGVFVPTVPNFPTREALQPFLVKHMVERAMMKRNEKMAEAIRRAAA